MKYSVLLVMVLFVALQSCKETPKNEIFNPDFKWTITIPENFQNVNPDEWKKMQDKGTEAVEKTYDGKVENTAKTIFVFKSDNFNYFESNSQPFDPAVDGDYSVSCRNVNNTFYGTVQAQIPGAQMDTLTTEETIGGLKFHKYTVTINLPNKMIMEYLMYSRLFDKTELTVNIITSDKAKQKVLLDAWNNSKFGANQK